MRMTCNDGYAHTREPQDAQDYHYRRIITTASSRRLTGCGRSDVLAPVRVPRYVRAHELAYRVRPTQDPHAVCPVVGAGQSVAPVPGVPADDLSPRPGRKPQGVSALRPSYAGDVDGAPGLDVRRECLHADRAAEAGRRPAAFPRHQALCGPAEGSAREGAYRRRHHRRARHHWGPQGGGRGDGVRLHRRLDGRRGR